MKTKQRDIEFDISHKDFYAEYKTKKIQEAMPQEHYHNAWELYFNVGESMTYFLKKKSYNVKKYDLVFVDKNTYHKSQYKGGKKERILIIVQDGFFDFLVDKEPIYKFLGKINETPIMSFDEAYKIVIAEKFSRIAELYETEKCDVPTLQFLFAELLATINILIDTGHTVATSAVDSKNSMAVSQITGYIEKNYAEKITLDFLAENFFVDKYHLCHIFKKETGMTIIEFINQKRLNEAKYMIKATDLNIGEIAENVGFLNQNYFGELFRKQYGMSPKTYRLTDK